ncbi:unnamed protein product [Discula destructiva]
MNTKEQVQSRTRLLDKRPEWETLGSGYEGDTFTFGRSVIKVFKPDRSPLRNCVPGSRPELQWPSEIPASLLLGGWNRSQHTSSNISDQSNFLPVQDYYFLPTSNTTTSGEWHLVTPFVPQGTLKQLAKQLRKQLPPPTTDQIDAHFRPALTQILHSLDKMHTQYGLCHEDIKVDNILVENSGSVFPLGEERRIEPGAGDQSKGAHWLLADLGNVRHISHSYHTSLLWAHDNRQHPDCRTNDVLRVVKTYVQFLESATGTTSESEVEAQSFNDAFLAASAPWSRLYWHTVHSAREGTLDGATAAQRISELSRTAFAPVNDTAASHNGYQGEAALQPVTSLQMLSWFDRWHAIGDSRIKAMAVRKELRTGMSLSEKWAKLFSTMGILKTPSRGC